AAILCRPAEALDLGYCREQPILRSRNQVCGRRARTRSTAHIAAANRIVTATQTSSDGSACDDSGNMIRRRPATPYVRGLTATIHLSQPLPSARNSEPH